MTLRALRKRGAAEPSPKAESGYCRNSADRARTERPNLGLAWMPHARALQRTVRLLRRATLVEVSAQ